jgi:hypothetical protein
VTIAIVSAIAFAGMREIDQVRSNLHELQETVTTAIPESVRDRARLAEAQRWLEKLEDERRARETRELESTRKGTPHR